MAGVAGPVGPYAGFWILDSVDFSAVLAFAECQAASGDGPVSDHFGLEAPAVNQAAVAYLLQLGFRIGSFMVNFMSDRPIGHFENSSITSPLFII